MLFSFSSVLLLIPDFDTLSSIYITSFYLNLINRNKFQCQSFNRLPFDRIQSSLIFLRSLNLHLLLLLIAPSMQFRSQTFYLRSTGHQFHMTSMNLHASSLLFARSDPILQNISSILHPIMLNVCRVHLFLPRKTTYGLRNDEG